MKYDFGGWATRNDLLCSDGRTIRKNAFKNQNGGKVPLVWNHNHSDPNNVLGHAYLENRDEGVYAYCVFTALIICKSSLGRAVSVASVMSRTSPESRTLHRLRASSR